VREVLRFLKRARKDEALTLQYDGERRRLSIIIEDPTGSRVRSYQLNTLDMGREPLKTPSLNFKAPQKYPPRPYGRRLRTLGLWQTT
jgi:hypothetical protein